MISYNVMERSWYYLPDPVLSNHLVAITYRQFHMNFLRYVRSKCFRTSYVLDYSYNSTNDPTACAWRQYIMGTFY